MKSRRRKEGGVRQLQVLTDCVLHSWRFFPKAGVYMQNMKRTKASLVCLGPDDESCNYSRVQWREWVSTDSITHTDTHTHTLANTAVEAGDGRTSCNKNSRLLNSQHNFMIFTLIEMLNLKVWRFSRVQRIFSNNPLLPTSEGHKGRKFYLSGMLHSGNSILFLIRLLYYQIG